MVSVNLWSESLQDFRRFRIQQMNHDSLQTAVCMWNFFLCSWENNSAQNLYISISCCNKTCNLYWITISGRVYAEWIVNTDIWRIQRSSAREGRTDFQSLWSFNSAVGPMQYITELKHTSEESREDLRRSTADRRASSVKFVLETLARSSGVWSHI